MSTERKEVIADLQALAKAVPEVLEKYRESTRRGFRFRDTPEQNAERCLTYGSLLYLVKVMTFDLAGEFPERCEEFGIQPLPPGGPGSYIQQYNEDMLKRIDGNIPMEAVRLAAIVLEKL